MTKVIPVVKIEVGSRSRRLRSATGLAAPLFRQCSTDAVCNLPVAKSDGVCERVRLGHELRDEGFAPEREAEGVNEFPASIRERIFYKNLH